MGEYQHVMYASTGTVEQVFSELYGDVDSKTVQRGYGASGSIKAKLGEFLSKLSSEFSGEITHTEIKSINFDDEMFRAKKLANELLSDEAIPNISDVEDGDLVSSQLYRFSCEVKTEPFESEIDGQRYIRVTGEAGKVKFRGDTSTDNWGLRSHIVQSVNAAKFGESYPYQGLMWPLKKRGEEDGRSVYDVNYLLICGPERHLMNRWYDRKSV